MIDRGAAGRRERVRCATGLITLGSGGAACRLDSAFGGVAKLGGGNAAGVYSTLRCGTTLVGGVSLGGFGGGAVGLASVGASAVLVF